jgi:hypothetical protein
MLVEHNTDNVDDAGNVWVCCYKAWGRRRLGEQGLEQTQRTVGQPTNTAQQANEACRTCPGNRRRHAGARDNLRLKKHDLVKRRASSLTCPWSGAACRHTEEA